MTLPWFRFYSEALRDRKLEYACRAASQPKFAVLAVWTALLCLANESPERGSLLIAEDMPVTASVVAGEIEMPEETVRAILAALEQLRRIESYDGVIVIRNWDKRQFASDDVTNRVRRWRAKRSGETLQQRYGNVGCNGPDTDTESERETEAEGPPQTPQTTHSETDELWERISDALRLQMAKATYEQWFLPARLLRVADGQVVIGFRNAAGADWARSRFGRIVVATVGRELGRDVAVEYEVMASAQ